MPQLDRTIIITQVFWLTLTFASVYILIVHKVLPNLLRTLKLRTQVADANLNSIEKFKNEQSLITNKSREILYESLLKTRKLSIKQMSIYKSELNRLTKVSNSQLCLSQILVKSMALSPICKISLKRGLPNFSPIGYSIKSN
nr:ATP synthase F0 subunit 8 [Cavernulicola chilensis]